MHEDSLVEGMKELMPVYCVIGKIPVCKTDGIKKCKAGSISLRFFKLKQIEVSNGQKTIDIRPRTRYNISNLIRKQCYHYCIAK